MNTESPRNKFSLGPISAIRIGLITLLTLTIGFHTSEASAQTATKVLTMEARGVDPTVIEFSISLDSNEPLKSLTLTYTIQSPETSVGGTQKLNIQSIDGTQEHKILLETNKISTSRYIPVGSTIAYKWDIENQDGKIETSQVKEFTYLDGRFKWKSKAIENVVVYYYGDDERGNAGIGAAVQALENISTLLETTVTYPVKVIIWDTEQNGEAAQRSRGASFDAAVMTLGTRVAVDLVHVYETRGAYADTIRHEVAHVVTHVAGDGTIARLPSWIDEGTAVYAQESTTGRQIALNSAIRNDDLFRPKTEGISSPSKPEEVDSFYGQSHSMVVFLIEEWGTQSFAQLFREIKGGLRQDDAFQITYGISIDEFYNLYREKMGLVAIEFAATSEIALPVATATQPPYTIPTGGKIITSSTTDQSTSSTSEISERRGDDSDTEAISSPSNMPLAALVGGISLLFALILSIGAFTLVRRKE